MPRFTLAYWNIRGLASPIRMLLWYVGEQDFEDKQYNVVKRDDGTFDTSDWSSVKPTLDMDFPNLPYLIDAEKDIKLTQSLAIMTYIASECKPELLRGSGPLAPYLDMVLQQVVDVRGEMTGVCYGSKSSDAVAMYRDTKLVNGLGGLEKFMSRRTNEKFVTSSLTYVDFVFAEFLQHVQLLFPRTLEKFPTLTAYVSNFFEQPEIKAFKESKYYMAGPINNKSAFVNYNPAS